MLRLPDIPTAITEREAERLTDLAAGKRVLEVGSLLGFSTVVMARVAKQVVSVDPHVGYPEDNPRPTLGKFMDNLAKYHVGHVVLPLVGLDRLILPMLQEGQFDFVFIDTTGRFEDTLRALRLTEPLLTEFGVVAVHDCGHPEWTGAEQAIQAWAEIKQQTYSVTDRLAVFQEVASVSRPI